MNKVKETKELLKKHYLANSRPLVVTFSGGKDSTLVLQLVLEMLLELKKENRVLKETFIVSSDTGVEMPIISSYLENILKKIETFCNKEELNVKVNLIKPKMEESFFSLLIGKGYPSPNRLFRWCTDRLKIRPTTYFLESLIKKNQSILMLLGVRIDESVNRANSINSRELNFQGLAMHEQIANAYVLSPIKNWTTIEVWEYLNSNPAPWGTHKEMMKLYSKGSKTSDGEADCNVALNPEAPSCGKTRFGCWTCTVVEKDRSMEGMIQKGEEWMKPLWDYREILLKYREDENRRESRRRNGMVGKGPFKLNTRKELLEKLLQIEQLDEFKNRNIKLISNQEIEIIQDSWNRDGDIENCAIKLALKYGREIENIKMSDIEESLSNMNIKDSTKNLFSRIYEIEKYRKNIGNRRTILNDIEKRVTSYFKGEFSEN